MELPGYQINEKIYEGPRTLVYRGIRLCDNQKVVIKLMSEEYPTFSELLQFRNQYAISKNLDLPGIVKSLSLEAYRNGYALVMEDSGGISLDKVRAKKEQIDLETALKIAIQLAEILHKLYQNRVIHKDIKPANILINRESKEVKLIDFSIASLLPREAGEIQNPNQLEGTLAYISPEQTGRMNRGIDYRSDFYGLGVTLYELLAGELPFVSDDSMELVHFHLSKEPPPLANRGEAIPAMLSDIVLKLMAKNAEDRYQSALGLKFDLEKCLSMWQETGSIEPFELGERDLSDRFNIPEKLYGRETEVRALLDAFVRVADGKTEMMLVAGFSGIGKTAVISEVHKPIVRARGYFIKGKFDQFQRNIPLSALVIALRDLMGQLLGESDSQLQRWKTRILDALGENAQVIIEVIPELERIIGKQPPAPELSGSAAQNRFNRLFQQFIRVFTTAEHPLVIFVDDLQWADLASLKLMEVLMGDSETGYLLLLGAYRDNEVFPAHPLMLTLDEIASEGATLNTITLEPLSQKELNRLVADTLSCELELALPLTELVYQKTKGNPFFATQFLNGLHEDGWIEYNTDVGYWECDMTGVRSLALCDDVVVFMATRLHKLPDETRELLKLAACIGDRFDLGTLAIVSEKSQVEAAATLWGALQEGFVLPLDETYKFFLGANREEKASVGYKFLHDRVQQAAYSLILRKDRQQTHLKIGRLLARHTQPSEIEAKIFSLVSQFNAGVELVSAPKEREDIARYNLMASRKAKNSAAYEPAWNYAKIGIDLLGSQGWENCYQLACELYLESVELAYLNGDFPTMENLAQIYAQKARSFVETIKIYQVKIQAYVAQYQLLEGVKVGLDALKSLGVNLPEEPTEKDLARVTLKIDACLGERAIADLINLPRMTDPNILATVEILSSLFAITYFTNPNLCWLTVTTQVLLSLENGNASVSAFAYANFGMMKCVKQEIDRGYEFGQLALSVLSELNAKSIEAKTLYIVNVGIKHWKEKLVGTVNNLKEVYLKGLETGDFEFAGTGAVSYCYFSYLPGKNLKELTQEMEVYGLKVEEIQQQSSLTILKIFWQGITNLQQKVPEPWKLEGELYSEEESVPLQLQKNDYVSLGYFYFSKIILAYLFGAYQEAARLDAEGKKYLSVLAGIPTLPFYSVYNSLTKLALYSDATEEEREEILSELRQNQDRLSFWAEVGPMNCQHKYDLVEAEKMRVLGNRHEAIELYDRAIAGAKENEYLREEALANELAAKFYLDWGKEKVAAGYMQDAYYCYSRWSAKAKVEDLEKRYPQLLAPILERQLLRLTPSATIAAMTTGTLSKTTTGTGQLLDLATLMKASRTLSEDISLEGAIANLMQVARENAGAETVALMLFQEEVLMLRALVRGEDAPQVEPVRVEESNAVPMSIINKVKRSLEALVLDNACNETAFAGEPYIQKHQPKSILCLPLIARGQLIGILYLENNRVAGAFTRDRLEVLNLLCSQAAISIENARLYEKSQQALSNLQQAQLQLIQSEKMSALGNLVAGVAHEINNPVGFIAGNLEPTLDYVQELFGLIELYQRKMPTRDAEIEAEIERMELEFIRDDLLEMISAMQEGTERLAHISTSLRTFSRTDKEHKVAFQLQDGIESTLLILKHRLKANKERPEIKIERNYEELPPVNCYPGQLNQVFMNLLANAIDAMDEGNAGRRLEEIKAHPNRISIKTSLEGERAFIIIADNGTGMPEAVKERIFEQGFTTKAVGKGTGLGMAIAYQIVVEKHGGTLSCTSSVGRGTEFAIALPLPINN